MVILDRDKFDELFKSTPDEPDPWKRVAAYQFNISYAEVTAEQKQQIKTMYFAYVYGIGPQRFGDIVSDRRR